MANPSQTKTVRVLVADDCELTRLSLKFALANREEVALVGLAADGLEAVKLASERRPDTVLLDLQMPVLDGWAAAPRLKEAVPDVRIVAYSSATEVRNREIGSLSSIDAYCDKETAVEEIVALIRALAAPSDATAVEASQVGNSSS